jgi:hypothetical protein
MSAAKTKAQGIIDDNAVAVFSKSYCPYCKAAKSLLTENGAKFYTIELDQVGTWNPTNSIRFSFYELARVFWGMSFYDWWRTNRG